MIMKYISQYHLGTQLDQTIFIKTNILEFGILFIIFTIFQTIYLITNQSPYFLIYALIAIDLALFSINLIYLVFLIIISIKRVDLNIFCYYLFDLIENIFFGVQLFLVNNKEDEINKYFLFTFTLLNQQTLPFKILSIIQIIIYKIMQNQQKSYFYCQIFISLMITVQITKKYWILSKINIFQEICSNKLKLNEKILYLLKHDKNNGILLEQDYNLSLKFSQDDLGLQIIPITLHNASYHPSQSPQECCNKTYFQNVFSLFEYTQNNNIKDNERLIAKDKKAGIKYIIYFKKIIFNKQKIQFITYHNISQELQQLGSDQNKLGKFQKLLVNALTHKLKTPLSTSIAHLTQAKNENLISSEMKSKYITPSLQNCQLQLYQVQDILEYVSNDFEETIPLISKVDIIEIVQKVTEIIETCCNSKSINYNFLINQEPSEKYNRKIMILTDENKLIRILINLLNNAYRFTSAGGSIRLGLESTGQLDDLQITFTVEDSGFGMTEDQFDLINRELSQQGSRQTSCYQKGSNFGGISLQITNILVKMLNNTSSPLLLLKSDNTGTKFQFQIENITDQFRCLKLTSVANIEYYKSARSISCYQQPHSSLFSQGQKLSVFNQNSKQPSSANLIRKNQEQQISFHDDEVEEEPSCQQLLQQSSQVRMKQQQQQNESVDFSWKLIQYKAQFERQKSNKVDKHRSSLKQFMGQDQQINTQHHSTFNFITQTQECPQNTNIIIIVDDEPFNHVSLSLILKKIGCSLIQSAYNGLECLEKVEELNGYVRAVLMDVDMPIMDGIQATEICASKWRTGELEIFPIIGCTAHQDNQTYSKCLEAGMVAVITKPVFLKQLLDIIRIVENTESHQKIQFSSSQL